MKSFAGLFFGLELLVWQFGICSCCKWKHQIGVMSQSHDVQEGKEEANPDWEGPTVKHLYEHRLWQFGGSDAQSNTSQRGNKAVSKCNDPESV